MCTLAPYPTDSIVEITSSIAEPGRPDVDARLLGGVVDGCGDAVELVELALDPGRARRARHARDVEVEHVEIGDRQNASRSGDVVSGFIDGRHDLVVVECLAVNGDELGIEVDVDRRHAGDRADLALDRRFAVPTASCPGR